MDTVAIISLLSANLVAILALIVKTFVPKANGGNPNHVSMDEKLDSTLECVRDCSRKLDTIGNLLFKIEGKIG